jgi:hypothetical protein
MRSQAGEADVGSGHPGGDSSSCSTGRSSENAEPGEVTPARAKRCDQSTREESSGASEKTAKPGAGCEAMRSPTMLCLPPASLAQLAEQLTLNQ